MSEKHRNAQKLMPQSRKLLKYQKRKIRRYLKRVRWRSPSEVGCRPYGAEEAEAEVFSVWTCTGCIHVPGEYMEDAGTDLVDPRDGCDRV